MNVVLINKFYPPSKSPTGDNLKTLVDYLKLNSDLNPIVLSINSTYKNDKSEENSTYNNQIRINPFLSSSKNKIIRLLSSIVDSYRLVNKAKKLNPDVIIYMTDPPFLGLLINIIGLKKSVKRIYWTMDLYPEAFLSANLVTQKNIIYKWFYKKVYSSSPNAIIALGQFQMNYLLSQFNSTSIKQFIYPSGIKKPIILKNNERPIWKSENEIVFGYCGNLGEAHSVEFLINFLDNFDFDKYKFILSIYGAKANQVLSNLKPNKNLVITSNVPANDLKYIDISLVSLLPEWTNVCVPSKAISAVCIESAIVFCGIKDSDNWGILSDASWFIDYYQDYKSQIELFFNNLTIDEINIKKINARKLSTNLNELEQTTLNSIKEYLIKK